MKKSFLGAAVALSIVLAGGLSFAGVKRAGEWPASDKPITVKIDDTRVEAVRKLADAAEWNLVVPEKLGGGTEKLHVNVKDEQPLSVLEALLEEGDYVATRHGKLVTVREAKDSGAHDEATAPAASTSAPSASASSEPAPPSASIASTRRSKLKHDDDDDDDDKKTSDEPRSDRGEDRSVMGGNAKIEKNEIVHDVSVMGGNVDIEGTVTGDVSVMGGRARVKDGAHVQGDAIAVGGQLDVDKGARVDGDVGVVGGVLHRHEGALIGGKVVSTGAKLTDKDDDASGDHGSDSASPHGRRASEGWLKQKFRGAGSAVTRAAMLFVFGVIVLSVFRKRHEGVKAEVVARPVKSFAIGIVTLLLSIVATVVLCLTVIGIPLAVVGWLFAALCCYGGIVSVLTLVGEIFLRHRTQNPYAYLAFGCGLFLLLGAIPVVGGIVTGLVLLVAIGSMVQTRAGGLFAKEPR